jgi:sulfide:quinone oxidoreductase
MAQAHRQGHHPSEAGPANVVIAGAGVAGLEAAFALRELAGDQTAVTLLAPVDEFVYRPMTVAEPFNMGWAERYPLSTLADKAHAELVAGSLQDVDVERHVVITDAGVELSYDALLIGLGASAHPRYDHVTSVDDGRMDDVLHGLVQDVEEGYVHSLAFIVPAPAPWPLPAYELALMTAVRAWDMQADVMITIVTPEAAPLSVFGENASRRVAELLERRRIEVITSATCEVPRAKAIRIHPGDRTLEVDRIVALPELRGPRLAGLPHDPTGFLAVDRHGKVKGVPAVWAAGDCTDFPVKHGGIAAQQADAAACSIAAWAGAPVAPKPFEPVIEGLLLTGEMPLRLVDTAAAETAGRSPLAGALGSSAPEKIAARYLAPHLARDVATPV